MEIPMIIVLIFIIFWRMSGNNNSLFLAFVYNFNDKVDGDSSVDLEEGALTLSVRFFFSVIGTVAVSIALWGIYMAAV